MDLEIQHTTHFHYPAAVYDSFNETRLQPVSNPYQERLSFDLEVSPEARAGEYRDFYQNVVHYFEVTTPHTELKVTARSRVRTGTQDGTKKSSTIPEPLHDYLQSSPYVSLPIEIFR